MVFFSFITLYIMEEFVVYILYSEKFNKNYTGYTSNLIERFKSHNIVEQKVIL
jgi:putative endonuclease